MVSRRAQADFDFVAFQTVLFLRSAKADAFQDVVALCVQKLGLGNVGVFLAVVKQDERFVFVAGCFVLQEGQLTQVAAFLIDDGFNRVCGNGNRGGWSKRGFGNAFAGRRPFAVAAFAQLGWAEKKCSQPAKIASEMAKNATSLLKSIRDSWN